MKTTLSALMLTLICGALQAHDAWIDEEGPAYRIAYGHHDTPESYDPKKVVAVKAFDATGKALDAKTGGGADGVWIDTGGAPAMIALDFDNGFWCKVDGKSRNVPKTELPGATDGSRSLKFGKTVLAWYPGLTRPVGSRLELVPVSEAAPKAGGTLTLSVLYEGRPVSGAKISTGGTHDGKPLTSDGKGRVTVPVHAGLNIVGAGYSQPWDGPEADRLNMAANLRFTVR